MDEQTKAIMYENYVYSHGRFETEFNKELVYDQPLGICDKNGKELFNHDTLKVVLNSTYHGEVWYVTGEAEIYLDKFYGLTLKVWEACAYNEKERIERFENFLLPFRYRLQENSRFGGLDFILNDTKSNKPSIYISQFETTLENFNINESHDIFFLERWIPVKIKNGGEVIIYVRPLLQKERKEHFKNKEYVSKVGMCFTKDELIFINDMEKKNDVTKMIEIPKTKEMIALVDKYLNYVDTHFGTNEDIERSKLLKGLSPWWQAVVVAYWENPSILKFAKFFGVTSYTARIVIGEILKITKITQDNKH